MFLDADEIITPSVKREISAALHDTYHQGFLLSYTNYFLGRRLRGGFPLRKLSLFRVGDIEHERIEEDNWSQCDMEVHEHPIVQGSVDLMRNRIDHRNLRGMDSYMRKHNEYAAWEARFLHLSRYSSLRKNSLSTQQRLKCSLLSSRHGGFMYFLGSYFVMGGWKDGSVGFAFAMLKACYFTQVACRLEELELNSKA